jgi:hypothetical protein
MKTRTITRENGINNELKKSLEQWDAERDHIQEKIDRRKLIIDKNTELKSLIQKEYSSLEEGTVRKTELEIKFLELDDKIESLKEYLKNYLFTFEYDFMKRYKEGKEKLEKNE